MEALRDQARAAVRKEYAHSHQSGQGPNTFEQDKLARINSGEDDPRQYVSGWSAAMIHDAVVYVKTISTGDVSFTPVQVAQNADGLINFKFPRAPSFPNLGGVGRDFFAVAIMMLYFETTNKGKPFKSEFVESILLPVPGSDRMPEEDFLGPDSGAAPPTPPPSSYPGPSTYMPPSQPSPKPPANDDGWS